MATTVDVFQAIAEPRRRQLLDVLSRDGEQAVGMLVKALGVPQPAVSKHLGVLRHVGLVAVTKRGQHRVYRLAPAGLKPVHDWVREYERFWAGHLDRIKRRAERHAAGGPGAPTREK